MSFQLHPRQEKNIVASRLALPCPLAREKQKRVEVRALGWARVGVT
jgi:hypothetical protein